MIQVYHYPVKHGVFSVNKNKEVIYENSSEEKITSR